ncbi:MAG: Vi polysaccharide biosynthesis UDP-N-acetylglucosamine C-6 dehydrogenase TviB [Cytophagales bacterium]|jgi:UDP-N-acetyl-D-galactosamine dehydrogenase|nr:Vi polysaccharide biosynthesis UDP-N-acetylglucosamine C-6 dehydrogenase TviB [Cytophagales bacterium]MCA6388866.1 Vi polysaccharide biosynthesis UDP-N-acetylglucosamine C-6 dehydrogenase TviB [Cytophagales bacterium]MCA6391096.1 Vi polysaccharide biosynthesis UDP-N-acetylglucosamine C-6 dehydrogenase TviB [Cytophagales bacterium]MCA6393889.1 Vi polysaccharide biosynthesis UDP-N-acetylglucosamine C-6 dehydrogenase TviB [Cytophagales bacterium]MCA6397759.1 Vi polysaccharide biosynthesis UDP-N
MEKIGIIGLGYVGLPLAVEFGKIAEVIGFDINEQRIAELTNGIDRTLEVDAEGLKSAKMLTFTSNAQQLQSVNYFIVTVPTPVDVYKNPDLTPLIKASETVGKVLKKGDIVIYESTVYPGCTEEDCVPVLEKFSGLKFNIDFFCGYSPERINPGDKQHRLPNIKKVTSGSTPEIAERVDQLYKKIIVAGTHKASSIKVAEAAKVIENAQRDINIAFVNELSLIFERMNIDTHEVLEAAGTKWNFLPYKPGLVGGHCIGVDPYYLTYKADSLGYYPQVILAGRRINDNMGTHIANRVIKLMTQHDLPIKNSKVLVLGITFKENCPDIRNSRAIDVIRELQSFGANVEVYDPHASSDEVEHEYGIRLIDKPDKKYSAIVLAVSHQEFKHIDWALIRNDQTIVYDVKGFLDRSQISARL